jgi:hypothetical protein
MKRILNLAIAVAGVAALAACSERPQTLDSGVKVDAQAFQGTGLAYAVPGWKQGDKSSWEQHEKVRTQMGQNEYTRVN